MTTEQKLATIDFENSWLIGCENSQVITNALRAKGVNAYSCDLLPTSGNDEYHLQCDVLELLNMGWFAGIFHPDCTFLTAANTYIKRGCSKYTPEQAIEFREQAIEFREQAIEFFLKFTNSKIQKWAIENPIGIMSSIYRKPDQIIHPWQFGHDASKATCLWIKNFPLLRPTQHIAPRLVNYKPRRGNQTDSGQNRLSPSEDRWKERAETYQGIADAIAAQWSVPYMDNQLALF
jgi:hypothetical protein